jgi:hypothetical protein
MGSPGDMLPAGEIGGRLLAREDEVDVAHPAAYSTAAASESDSSDAMTRSDLERRT